LVPLGIRNPGDSGEVAHAGLLKTTAARDEPQIEHVLSSNGKTFFSARRSSASDTPALTVRGSERSARHREDLGAAQLEEVTAAARSATWTSAADGSRLF